VVDRGNDDTADLTDPPLLLGAQTDRGFAGVLQAQDLLHRVLAPAEQPDAAHVQDGVALTEGIAADVTVAAGNRVLQLRQGDPVLLEARGIRVDLVTLDGAARAGNIRDARDAPEGPLQRPVLQRLEVVQGVDVAAERVLGTAQRVAEDFAGGRLRGDLRGDAGGQVRRELQAGDDFFPRLFEVHPLFEMVAEVGKTEQGPAPGVFQPRYAGQGHFEGDGDLALHLFGRGARVLGDYLDDGRRRVGVGLHVDVLEGIAADRDQGDGEEKNDQGTVQG